MFTLSFFPHPLSQFLSAESRHVVHTISGCTATNLQSAPAKGWSRYQFDPAQAVPAIVPDATVMSIALMLDEGPEAGITGMVVLDNININGTFIGHE